MVDINAARLMEVRDEYCFTWRLRYWIAVALLHSGILLASNEGQSVTTRP